ncbi:PQQ-dependent sugar dehydrogenase [Roseateles violae]|uniref:Sorbosone dehydrogenase family protein n=1 Tax=Roseateles violae TaxID=3058042 RepID=A0ABT8DXK5_9BURK|nr:sorbosone dehydrogenase family protein [Pelomonas sp. PFR6]MDN3921539.1 sorbosone dehydrogenase family protein [Pelomonas sp. PFR6]
MSRRLAMHPLLAASALLLTLLPGAALAQAAMPPGFGPNPVLPAPQRSLLPTIHVADAVGWRSGDKPTPAPGLAVAAFAAGLEHPRWLYVLPNGDVLVAETNAPPRPEDGQGLRAWFQKLFMKKAGAATPSANRITLLRDADGDGRAETRSVFAEGLNSPLGMALVGNDFYIANTDAVIRYRYAAGQTRLEGEPVRIAALPAGPRNHHWTKSLLASPDGTRLYVGVGSNSNVAENGIEAEEQRASILEIDLNTGAQRVYASGLRNPVGLAWEPGSGQLWAVVNERDELGNDLVPDYLSSVREGGFYGWPYSYFGSHLDERVEPQRPELVAAALVPDYALGAHTASLGLASAAGNRLPADFANGMFIGQHGSWNRKPRSGYRVLFVPFADGRPQGPPVEVLGGFLNEQRDEAMGRPVGVAIDRRGALLVADDVGNVIWRVTAQR